MYIYIRMYNNTALRTGMYQEQPRDTIDKQTKRHTTPSCEGMAGILFILYIISPLILIEMCACSINKLFVLLGGISMSRYNYT